MDETYRLVFQDLPWSESPERMRSKTVDLGGVQLRLVEFGRDIDHPDWCTKGHVGYVLDGVMEIEFEAGPVIFRAGDGINIPSGDEHRHRPKAQSDIVRLIFFEDRA